MTAQSLIALEEANRVRMYRANVKRGIRSLPKSAGLVEVAGHLDDPMLASMELGELLRAVRGFGPRAIVRFCAGAQVFPGKRLGTLTGRQVQVLRSMSAVREGQGG